MAKKIRFPLRMAEGTEVKTIEELREHFDLQSVLEHYKSGKLLTWLEARYLEGEAEAVRELDEAAPGFQRRLCEVFQVEYAGDEVDLDAVNLRQERLKKLRAVTDEAEYIDNIDRVAFDQEELADLLDEGETTIYLCGEKFTIPASQKGITYVGIQNPAVHISGKLSETLNELGITFTGASCDNLPPTPKEKEPLLSLGPNELPPEIVCDMLRGKFFHSWVTEHYCLRKEESDEEDATWHCFEMATGEETEFPHEIADALTECAETCAETGMLKIFGDEVCCRNFDENTSFILDLNSKKIEMNENDLNWGLVADFNADFAITFDEENFDCGAIEIIRRKAPQERKILMVEEADEGSQLFLNGTLLSDDISEIYGYPVILDGKVYFAVSRQKYGLSYHLACYDLDTGDFQLLAEIERWHGSTEITGNGNYIYLASGYGITAIDVRDGAKQGLFSADHSEEFQLAYGQKGQYIVFVDGKETNSMPGSRVMRKARRSLNEAAQVDNGSPNLYAVELATLCVKKIPFHIELGTIATIGLAYRFFVIGSTLYYCAESDGKELGENIGFKFDLTQATPAPEKFKF